MKKNGETGFHFIEQLHCFIVETSRFDVIADHSFFSQS